MSCPNNQLRSNPRFYDLRVQRRFSNSQDRRRGFSLVELIVVMVILGLLAGLVVTQTRGYLIRSRQKIAETEIATLVSALETFYANENRYPTTDEGLDVLTEPSENYPEPYIRKLTKDPWGNPYEYFSPGSNGPYEVICLGGDGREGGDGENRDFSSDTLGV